MILLKLKMKNFRQFIGTQEIVFAAGNGDRKENITVIFGENGRGKTGIYRAIMFCLYGLYQLSQDDHVEEKELHLVNRVVLNDVLKEGKNEPVECFVELKFSHEGSIFHLKRKLFGMLDGSNIIQERGPVSLLECTPDGNTKPPIDDNKKISCRINAILDERVREYFLFDGEKIERLTKASPEQRREISKGLRNLLNIDALQTAKRAMARLQKSLDSQLEQRSTGEYAKVLRKIKESSELQTQLEERVKQLEDEIATAVTEKRQVDT